MTIKKIYLFYLLICLSVILFSYTYCIAQYAYNPNSTVLNPYYQTTTYPYNQIYSYTPNATTYINPLAQLASYDPYSSIYTGQYNPYAAAGYGYQTINPYANPYADPYANSYANSYAYNSYNPYTAIGYNVGLNPYLPYYPAYNKYGLPINNLNGNAGYYLPTSSSNGGTSTTDATNLGYTTQATTYYPISNTLVNNPFQINPLAFPNIYATPVYPNPLSAYIPSQSYYQNPYLSYPYAQLQTNTNYPIYQGYTTNTTNTQTYTQSNPYTQPLPYYQTTYYPQANTTTTTTATTQGTILTVTGNWTGTWFTTLASGTVENGSIDLALNQNASDITGNVAFTLNNSPKLSTTVSGSLQTNGFTLTGSLFNGNQVYTLTITSSISNTNLSGSYTIRNNTGSVVESGTFSASRI